ncbi:hypothetical protein [uncultured Hymenobacter sp.]|uniref:hypothetical protein n=1 Tax=uncultured Hymenobacter sp. TaxID=170016 RepID=UPI0035CBE736
MSDNAESPADQAWQELLHRLRDQPAAPPRPFFYTRLQARLAEVPPAPRVAAPRWLHRPAYAAIVGLLTVILHADSTSGSSGLGEAARLLSPTPSAAGK